MPSHAAAWRPCRTRLLISAPSAASSSSARSSVLFVYVVVTRRSCLAFPAMTSECIEHRVDPAPANERHHDVNRVGRVDLGAKLVSDGGLAARVRQERRVEQRRQWCFERLRRTVGHSAEDRREHSCGIERHVDVPVNGLGACGSSESSSMSSRRCWRLPRRDLPRGAPRWHAFHDHGKVARQTICRLGVGEIPKLAAATADQRDSSAA